MLAECKPNASKTVNGFHRDIVDSDGRTVLTSFVLACLSRPVVSPVIFKSCRSDFFVLEGHFYDCN